MDNMKRLSLEEQIEKEVKKITPDSYPVSIGEVVNMYKV
jgi:hypothetical protein